MADCEDMFRPMEVFWTKDDTFDEDTAYIPGVMNPGNRRPQRAKPKIVCKKNKEVKPKASSTQLAIQKPSSKCSQKSTIRHAEVSPKSTGDNSKTAKATLKDLCADDKKRVANLIKELARLGEAKDTMSGQLESERQIFERRIQDLIDQQDRISKERENVKDQLAECQKLLARYQEYLEQSIENKVPSQLALSTNKVASDMCHSSHDDMISTHSRIKPNTCRLLRHWENKQEIPDKHLFPVYIEPKIHTDHKTEQFMTLQSKVSELSPPERDISLDERFCSLKHDEDVSFTDRPFTKKIDRIIAEEKRSDEALGGRALNPAVQSEVQTSRISVKDGPDFHPLFQNDNHHLLSQQSDYDIPNQQKGVGFQSPIETVMCSPLDNGNEFVNYYKNLGPEERRRQLMAQKMALLEEQKRLKTILMEQEQMLRQKQDHLHRQQEIQQKRLKHFENTGTFPPHHRYKQPIEGYEAGSVMTSMSSLMLNGHITEAHSKLPTDLRNPHPSFGSKLLPDRNNVMYNNNVAVIPEYHGTSLYEQQQALKPGANDQLESTEQTEPLFEKQMADTHAIIAGQQTEVTKKMMSRATSPIRLHHLEEATLTEPATEEQIHGGDNPLRPPRVSRFDDVKPRKIHEKPMYIQTSELIDLVNEVDEGSISPEDGSIHVYTSAVRQSLDNRDKLYCDSDNGSYINDINSFDEQDPDEEESRVLEDVFFIK